MTRALRIDAGAQRATPFDGDALVARAAGVALGLTFVVICASAFLRHLQAGLGCGDWPSCYATIDAASGHAVAEWSARLAHRFAASGALLLALAVSWLALRRPALARYRGLALTALGITLALAALGLATPAAQRPIVVLGNLLGGFALAATYAALAARAAATIAARNAKPSPTRSPSPVHGRRAARALSALAFAVAALGGMIGAQYALTSCTTLPSCADASWPALLADSAWDPLRIRAMASGAHPAPPGAALLHVVHRAAGVALAAAMMGFAIALARRTPRAATALSAIAATAVAAGVAAVALAPSLAATLVHNLCAALAIALLAGLAASDGGATLECGR